MKEIKKSKIICSVLSGALVISLYLISIEAYAYIKPKEGAIDKREIVYNSRFYEIQKDAENGIAHAQYLIGMMHQTGYNVEIDLEKASEWLHASALQGYPLAQNEVGMLYETGQNGVIKNVEIAYYWYKLAAIQDYAPAADNLAYMLANGKGVERDFNEALVWYERAAEQGYIQAIQNLAWLLATVPVDGLRNGARALRLIEPIAMEYSDNPGILDTLAAACAEVGLFAEAVAIQEEAIRFLERRASSERSVAMTQQNRERVLRFTARLMLYKNDKPWRRK